jgi:hypothetical protein
MTMEPNHHPDDERLAAFAGGEPDVELRLHLRGCARCSSIVDELAMLRTALAELPDLAPSRPLQLIPRVPAPQPSAVERLAGWTRRAFMPLLAAGFGLAIVGSVGTVGSTFSMGSAGASFAPASRDLSATSTPAEGGGAAAASASANTDSAGAAPGSSKAASPAPGFVAQSASAGATASPAASSAVAESASASPAAERVNAFEQSTPSTPRSLWPMVLFAGLALIVGTLLLRWIVQPRAG